jgi:hypothetical protein
VIFLVLAVEAGRHLIATANPVLQLAMVLTLTVLACMGLLLHDRRGNRAMGAAAYHATLRE